MTKSSGSKKYSEEQKNEVLTRLLLTRLSPSEQAQVLSVCIGASMRLVRWMFRPRRFRDISIRYGHPLIIGRTGG